jgi:hypothetical protein
MPIQANATIDIPYPCSSDYKRFMDKIVKKITIHNKQVVGALGGMPGSGKSCRAQEMYWYINKGNCKKEQITFTKQELYDAVDTSYKEAVILDEGLAVLFSREAMRKEGVEIQGLFGEMRQRNLAVLICIWDLLSLDSMTIRMMDFVASITDGEQYKNGKREMYKGNMEIWIKTKHRNHCLEYLRWLRNSWTNPQFTGKRPAPQLRIPGSVYREHMGDDGKFIIDTEGFYAVDKVWYKERKEQVRKRHKHAFDKKKPNRQIDFKEMDKMLAANMRTARIAEILDTSQRVVQLRNKLRRSMRSEKVNTPLERKPKKRKSRT